MALTKQQIITQAYNKIGAGTYVSDDDNTKEAKAAAGWDGWITNCLGAHLWNFNKVSVDSSPINSTPVDTNWRFAHAIPPDSVNIATVHGKGGGTIPFEVTDVILCNSNEIKVQYHSGDYPVALFKPYFVEYLKAYIANEVVEYLSGNEYVIARCETNLTKAFKTAVRHDNLQQAPAVLYGAFNSPLVNLGEWN